MAVDEFRRTDVVLDKANGYILDEQFGKVGDIKGRDLVVQITNDGVIQDQSGLKLVLAWTHNQVKNTGIEPFEELNVQQGIFKVTYPVEMMNEGYVTANIGVFQENGTTFTRNFTLRVEKNAGNADAAITSDSWTVLVDALEKVNSAEQLLKDTIAGLEEKYGSTLGDMTAFRKWDPTLIKKMSNEFTERMLNVKWFGAKGDGETDDTVAIKAAVDYAFNNGANGDLSVYFPAGTYNTTAAIPLKATNNHDDFYLGHGVKLVGHDKATTKIVKTAINEGDFVNATITVNGVVSSTGEQAKSGAGIQIKNLSIANESTDLDSYAIYGKAFQRGIMDSLNIYAVNGIYLLDPYSSRYIDISLNTVESGIWLDGGTSNYLQSCYGRTGNNPFRISSFYSLLDNCYTGDCSGTLFDFPESNSITMIGCGDESSHAKYKIAVAKGTLSVDSYFTNFPGGDPANNVAINDSAILHIKGNVVASLKGLCVGFPGGGVIVDSDAYLLWFDDINTSAGISVDGIRYSTSTGWGGEPGGNVHRLIYSNRKGSERSAGHIQGKGVDILTRRNSIQPYLGNRGLRDSMNNQFTQKAIYLDNISTTVTSTGDVTNEPGYNQGDVLLYNNPAGRYLLGAVATNTAATVGQNTFANIPIILSGPTANRPVGPEVGVQYMDTTLNQPVWWAGTHWVDASGGGR